MSTTTPQPLQQQFQKTILPELQKSLELKNVWTVPRLKAVKINVGLGPYVTAKKDYSEILENLQLITGQKPVVTKARQSISNFKIREGMPVGAAVTIRGKKMYDFVNKLVNIVFPRVRDFRGISPKAFDKHGNYTIGFSESIVFPEVNPENLEKIHGLQITIVTTAKDNESGYKLLKALGFPFQKPKAKKSTNS